QLTLAEILNLPVVIHTRNKNEQDRQCIKDTLAILSEFRNRIFGVLHSFSGNLSELEQTLDLGYHIGITGPVTFSKAHDLRRLINSLPLERLLIETDSPFLTPHPHRGKRNQPSYVALIAEKIAQVLDRTTSEIAKITTANANHLFQWS
ncbi:MAG: TatD family hydrolase, partial [Chloroflexota bacterium]